MTITPVEIWLVVGIIFILIEFSKLPGIGFLFLSRDTKLSSCICWIFVISMVFGFMVAT